MGITSLILGIIASLVAFSIFKDLALILAIVGIVLGVVSLCKKKNKVLSIIGIVFAAICFVVLFSNESTTTVTSNNSNVSSGKEVTNRVQTYKLGDDITIKNNSGDEYNLQITDIRESSDRNQFSDKKPTQVFVIDYTYSCVKSTDSLYISDMNFKIIDETGEIGESYPISVKDPQSITAGTTCKAQMALCVYNESKKIKLQYFDNMFNGTPDVTYEIEIPK